MPHILLNRMDFNDNIEFQTNSAILNITPYDPRVLIVGTYNEANIKGNTADFFYGRNFFWPVFFNLSQNENLLIERRILKGRKEKIPTLGQVLNICSQFKLSFADLITDVTVQLPNHGDNHLDNAIGNDKSVNNDKNIVNYINRTRSITHVYSTTKFGQHRNLKRLWDSIKIAVRKDITFGSILTPSGQGGVPNFSGTRRTGTIARYWLWVNHVNNPYGEFINQDGYIHLDHTWLVQCGVNPNLF